MITLITGVPGAGKTLNTIKRVVEEHGKEGRPIYYRGIRDLSLDWTEIDDDQVRNWSDLPDGSVIVVDECQQVFPNRAPNKPTPDGVAKLDTHRHRGFDFYFITQKPTMIDFGLRGFAGRHFHYERGFGREGTRELEFQKAVDKPDDYHTRQEAQITRVKFDKKYYDVYKSAEIHTHKPRMPKKAFVMVGAVLFTITMGVMAFNSITGRMDSEEVAAFDASQFESIPIGTPGRIDIKDSGPDEYIQKWIPRVQSLPFSAPIYDEVAEVKTFPKPHCIRNETKNKCKCYTQQATPLDIDRSTCDAMVDGGWFDPFREEEEEGKGRGGQRQALAAAAPSPTPQQGHSSDYIQEAQSVRVVRHEQTQRTAESGFKWATEPPSRSGS